jgi:hypothetical protein
MKEKRDGLMILCLVREIDLLRRDKTLEETEITIIKIDQEVALIKEVKNRRSS